MFIGDNPKKTSHAKIQKTNDPYIPFDQLKIELDFLKELLENNKTNEVKKLLGRLIEQYKSNSEIVDHLYTEQLLNNKIKKNLLIDKNKDKKVIKIQQ